MSAPSANGMTPQEQAFLCEMEIVTVIPRQKLEAMQLLSGTTPALRPPRRAELPLWLALLLKRQRKASIVPPPWMHAEALQHMLEQETSAKFKASFTPTTPLPAEFGKDDQVSPPFQQDSTASAGFEHLPYHYMEMSQLLLANCADDIPDFEQVQKLLRDLREVRLSKARDLVHKIDAIYPVSLSGIGATELGENRTFLQGVADGLRKLGASREASMRELLEDEERDALERDDDTEMEL